MTTEIKVQDATITAHSTIDQSWNNASSNSYWGSGYVLTKDNLFITLSENHQYFFYLIEDMNWKLI
jgi:hypothetical protein